MQLIDDLIKHKKNVGELTPRVLKAVKNNCRYINGEKALRVLYALKKHGPMTTAVCAESAGILSTALSHIRQDLIDSGLVREIRDDDDLRVRVLSITKKGADDLARFEAGL